MNDNIKQQILMSVQRSSMIAEMDKNRVRRDAKIEILRLVEIDLNATCAHIQTQN